MKTQNDSEYITNFISSGGTLTALSHVFELSINNMSYIVKNMFGMGFRELRYEMIKKDLERVKAGKAYIFQIRRKYGYNPVRFYNIINRFEYDEIFEREKQLEGIAVLDLKESLEDDGRPSIDCLIEKGFSLGDIQRECNIRKQFIALYIKGSGQYNFWKEKRKEYKDEHQINVNRRANLIYMLRNSIEQRSTIIPADTVKERCEKVIAKSMISFHGRKPTERMEKMLEGYFSMLESNQLRSFTELAKIAGYADYTSVVRQLERMHLDYSNFHKN